MYILYLSEAAHRVLSRYIIPIPIPMRGGSLIILQSCVVLLFMYIVELQNIVHSKYNYIEKLNAPFFGQLSTTVFFAISMEKFDATNYRDQ